MLLRKFPQKYLCYFMMLQKKLLDVTFKKMLQIKILDVTCKKMLQKKLQNVTRKNTVLLKIIFSVNYFIVRESIND